MAALNWWGILIVIVIVGAIAIAVYVVVGTHSRARSSKAGSTTALRVTRIIAWFYAATSVIATVAGALQCLFHETVPVRSPAEPIWPSRPSTVQVEGTTADVVGGVSAQDMVKADTYPAPDHPGAG